VRVTALRLLVGLLLAPLGADDFSARQEAWAALKRLPVLAVLGWDHPDPEVQFACRAACPPPRYYDFLSDPRTVTATVTLIHPDPAPTAAEVRYWAGKSFHPDFPNCDYGPAWHLERVARDLGLMCRHESIQLYPVTSDHWIVTCRARARTRHACGRWAWRHFVY
jgi:hypothetical protein